MKENYCIYVKDTYSILRLKVLRSLVFLSNTTRVFLEGGKKKEEKHNNVKLAILYCGGIAIQMYLLFNILFIF